MDFPNKAGDHEDTDNILEGELRVAGIHVEKNKVFRSSPREVVSSVIGTLHGWCFTRNWVYWVCKGPGIEVKAAEKLHKEHGQTVRVDGHCGCPSPRDHFKGLACGNYHVDNQEGLNALADTIRMLVNSEKPN